MTLPLAPAGVYYRELPCVALGPIIDHRGDMMHSRFAQIFTPLAAALVLASCTAKTPDSAASAPPPATPAAAVAPASRPITPVAFSGCVSPHEREAFEVYALRTQALVGAQSCRMTDRFNKFILRFRGELTTEGRALRGYYQKKYGKGGDATLDKFVTELSNTTFVAGSGTNDLCATTTALFDSVMAAPVGQLAAYSSQHRSSALPAMDSCDAVAAKSP
jgi:hypothetical protein